MEENNKTCTLLIVDDEPANLQKLKRTFIGKYQILEASSAEEALTLVRSKPVDMIITDQKMPRMTGIELLKQVLKINPDIMRIILTGYTEVDDLIDAINEGHVYRYIVKPWEPEDLRITVRQALERLGLERENRRLTAELKTANERLRTENRVLQDEVKRRGNIETLIFRSRTMQEVVDAASRVAGVNSTVLLTGETGTGKEVVARFIHRESRRSESAFVAVNCGAIPRELVESEFFGYRKGAFSGASTDKKGYFQIANGGTLFLDEIGEAPLELQVKLLRVLQNSEIWPVGSEKSARVDVRVIASTNRELHEEVRKGQFREDLFFRLNVFSIRVPPLRERREDIMPLAEFFLKQFQGKMNRRLGGFGPGIPEFLEQYSWPGNVRQLENEMERLVLMTEEGKQLACNRLSPYLLVETHAIVDNATAKSPLIDFSTDMDMRHNLENLEKRLIYVALEQTGGNRSRAADILGITRQSLLDRMKRYDIH